MSIPKLSPPAWLPALVLSWLSLSAQAADPRQLPLHARQLDAMGVAFAAAEPAGTGAPSLALPARVVIPQDQQRVLSAPAAGLIEQLRAAPQQNVRPGERLGQLAAPALLEAQRALIQAASQQRLAEDNAQRDEVLLAEGIIPAARARVSRAQAVEAQALRRERELALRLQGVGADRIEAILRGEAVAPVLDLVSPGSGTVVEVLAAVGQRVETGAPLLRIARLDRLWLELQVPVADAGRYHAGDTLEVDGRPVQARILQVGHTANPDSQVVELRAAVPGNAGLRAGETVAVRVHAGAAGGHWRLPAAALVSSPQGPLAYVRTQHGVRTVALERVGETPEGPLVRGDLKAGDRVAVRGVAALRAAELASREER